MTIEREPTTFDDIINAQFPVAGNLRVASRVHDIRQTVTAQKNALLSSETQLDGRVSRDLIVKWMEEIVGLAERALVEHLETNATEGAI